MSEPVMISYSYHDPQVDALREMILTGRPSHLPSDRPRLLVDISLGEQCLEAEFGCPESVECLAEMLRKAANAFRARLEAESP